MRTAIFGFSGGILLLQNQAELPSWLQVGYLFLAVLFLTLLLRHVQRLRLRVPVIILIGALSGFTWGATFAQYQLTQQLPAEWEGRDITLIGTVDSLPQPFEQGVRFNFSVEQILPRLGAQPPSNTFPSHLSLSWYSEFAGQTVRVARERPSVESGQRWRLTVRLKRPHGNANPHGFDYEVWLLEQGLRATGYVHAAAEGGAQNQLITAFVPGFSNFVERARSQLRQRILNALPAHEYVGIIVALVIGDQRAVSESDWKVFNRTGISHLISISGMHITMVAGLFAGLVFWLWRHSFFIGSALPLWLPAQKAAALAGTMTALLYVLLAGFGVPAQRTLYMISVVALALWTGRITSVSHVLCLALAVVLVLDPWAVLWPGFWLSFTAVGVIFYTTVGRSETQTATRSHLQRVGLTLRMAAHTQYVITLALVPLTLLLFSQVSLVSPLANAIAIPLVSLLVTPLALIGSVAPAPLAGWILEFAHWLVQGLASAMRWLDSLPWAVWSAPTPELGLFLLALLGTAWLLAPRGWPQRWLGLICWLPLLMNAPTQPQPNQLWVTAFDVGQGSALLIETERHRLLYDTGPSYSRTADAGARTLLPYLKSRGINTLDGLVVTHNDSDHSGGALSVLEQIRVGWVASSLSLTSPIVRASPQHRHCRAGQHWTWDGVYFEMLRPYLTDYENAKATSNSLSCVLRISAGKQAILLPGDIGVKEERRLVEQGGESLRSSVLLAPHHGSGTSSSEPFLTAVQPQIALFQVGYHNRYHHPKSEIFERYGGLGITRLRSDESGAVLLRFDPTAAAPDVVEYRRARRRYWYDR